MSDFDREAERERLREKYEQDQEKRASTQRMSELLLRGATMTDSHCETCGDPIFRYEGEEFCATCAAEEDAGGETAGQDDTRRAENAGAGQEQARASQSRADDEQPGAEQTPEAPDGLANGAETSAPAQHRERAAPAATRGGPEPEPESEPAAPQRRDEEATADDSSAGLSAARESLVRAATRFARQAEAADHPSEAVDHLAAAREAAEALAALDRR